MVGRAPRSAVGEICAHLGHEKIGVILWLGNLHRMKRRNIINWRYHRIVIGLVWRIVPCPKQRPRRAAACHLAHSPDLGLDSIVTIVRAASTSTRSTRRSRVTIVAREPLASITREAPPRADADADRSRRRRRVRTSSRAAGTSTRWRRVLSTTSALALLFTVAARAQAVRWVRARLKFKRDDISF